MRYAKRCCCLSLRFGIIIIGAVDIVLSALALGFNAASIHAGHRKSRTNSTGTQAHRKAETIDVAAVIGVIGQLLIIFVAISLIMVAVKHKAKFRKVLTIWLGFTFGGLIIIIVSLFVRVIVYKTHYIDIIITLGFSCYEVICIWLVVSYYKLLGALGDHHDVGYDAFANENDFSSLEKPTELNY